jgi:hypothetical protein
MKAFEHAKICNLSDNREHFTSHGFHMIPKGKHEITKKWASFIVTNLVRNHPLLIIPLPWTETKNCGLVEFAKCNDLMMDRGEFMQEDENVECRVLKLRMIDQKVSLLNNGVKHNVLELQMFDEDK